MKISKLFHWLYAGVMLLPMFAIGVTCGYAMFNKNAYLSKNKDNVKDTIEIQKNGQIDSGITYYVTYNESTDTNATRIDYSYITVDWTTYGAPQDDYDGFAIQWYGNSYTAIYLYVNNQWSYQLSNIWGNTLKDFSFTCSTTKTLNGNSNYNMFILQYNEITLQNVFYNAVDKVTESPLFSWSYNSFLVAPFSYIVALFGMPTNHVVVELLSYWLAISIIWLVFDLVMYVPLLVHRWLDKGVLE